MSKKKANVELAAITKKKIKTVEVGSCPVYPHGHRKSLRNLSVQCNFTLSVLPRRKYSPR